MVYVVPWDGGCSMTINLVLPYPPSLNSYYRHVVVRGKPVTLISKVGRRYRTFVLTCVLTSDAGKVAGGPIAVAMRVHPPTLARVQDVDNSLKALFDALQSAGVYSNDRQICRLEVIRGRVSRPGRVEIAIEPYDGEGSEYVRANSD